ncbi:MAG: HEAT repeat domain-containing protein [Nitrospirota bacterium]
MVQFANKLLDIKTMIADYMENGFLDNIIDMFKYDTSLYAIVGELMKDERLRVRIGISALIETLKKEDSKNIPKAVPYILPLLKDQNPVIRGDAAYLLGVIGNADIIPTLNEIAEDENENVRLLVKEAVEDIKANSHAF